jgi:peptide/nickel transport system substrate-binding protein
MDQRSSRPWLANRTSRRRFLAGAATATAGGALWACTGSKSTSTARTPDDAGTPQPGGTLKSSIFYDPDNLDPAQGGFGFVVFQRMYSYLHHIDGRTLEYIPDLASSYEQPDDLTYIFRLRDDVQFADLPPVNGRGVTAHDVAYSFERLNKTINQIDPGFMARVVDKLEATNDYTVRVTTKRPYASALQVLGGYWYAVVPREAVEEFGDLTKNGIGSGPYTLASYEQERGASLVRNPSYYKTPQPYLDGIDLTVITDPTNSSSQFRAKQLDSYAAIALPIWESLKSDLDVNAEKVPGILDPWVGLNLRREPWLDPRARQAFDLAIDRKQMIQTLAFGDGRLNGPIPWGNEKWALPQDELELAYAPNKEEARALFEAAGITDLNITHRVTPALPLGAEIGEILKEQLRPYGVNVSIDVREQNDWIQTVILNQDFDTCGFAWFPVLDPTVSLRFVDKDDIFSGVMFGFDDPEITALYQKMQSVFDYDARRDAMNELQRAVLDFHGPVLHMFDAYFYNLWWPWLHNFKPQNIELDWYSSEHWLSERT